MHVMFMTHRYLSVYLYVFLNIYRLIVGVYSNNILYIYDFTVIEIYVHIAMVYYNIGTYF